MINNPAQDAVITLTPLVAAIYFQLLLIFLVLSLGFYIYVRRLQRQTRSSSSSSGEETTHTSVAHYLATEIKLTQGRRETLYHDTDGPPDPELTEEDILTLRERYLDFEATLLEDTARENAFWIRLAQGIKRLLNEAHLVKRIPATEAQAGESDDEAAEINNLMKQQQDELDRFLSSFDEEEEGISAEELKGRLKTIANSHRELSHCIFSLEDENRFLREQIASLLQNA